MCQPPEKAMLEYGDTGAVSAESGVLDRHNQAGPMDRRRAAVVLLHRRIRRRSAETARGRTQQEAKKKTDNKTTNRHGVGWVKRSAAPPTAEKSWWGYQPVEKVGSQEFGCHCWLVQQCFPGYFSPHCWASQQWHPFSTGCYASLDPPYAGFSTSAAYSAGRRSAIR